MTTRTLKARSGGALLALFFCAHGGALSQTDAAARTDGAIIESAPYELPAYDQLPDGFKTDYSKEAVERIRNSQELELLKIKYMSDGLKTVGFIYKPKQTEGRKLPVIIFNRGGLADGAIGPQDFKYLYEMHRNSSFIVPHSSFHHACRLHHRSRPSPVRLLP
jgi:hypothetical protein